MKHQPRPFTYAVVFAALAAQGATQAAEPANNDLPTPATAAAKFDIGPGEAASLPQTHESGTTRYVTGGAVYEQIPAFNKARAEYPLNVEIYEKSGSRNQFTADVDVKLVNTKSGDLVLEAKTDGPYLWAKVPPGQYKLTTSLNGKEKESRVSVSGVRPTRAVVVFPEGTSPTN